MYTQIHYYNSIIISSELNNSNLLSFLPVHKHYKFAIIHTKVGWAAWKSQSRVSQGGINLTSNEPLNLTCILIRDEEQEGTLHNNIILLKLLPGRCTAEQSSNQAISIFPAGHPAIHGFNFFFCFFSLLVSTTMKFQAPN